LPDIGVVYPIRIHVHSSPADDHHLAVDDSAMSTPTRFKLRRSIHLAPRRAVTALLHVVQQRGIFARRAIRNVAGREYDYIVKRDEARGFALGKLSMAMCKRLIPIGSVIS
jgi:hypothetical protein